MASGRLVDYIGYGDIASRPVAPDLQTGAIGLYWADDEDILYVWDGAWASVVPAAAAVAVEYQLPASDLTTPLTTGTNKAYFRAPRAFHLTEVRASLLTAAAVGIVTIDINKNGATLLTTKLTIDATEKTSVTAAVAAVIDATLDDIADDDEITIDIDVSGDTAVGLIVTLIGTAA